MTWISFGFGAIAGLLHVAIFAAESVLWRRPQVWRRFGVAGQQDADTMAFFAFNQGFYNLFLAGAALAAPVAWAADHHAVAWTLLFYACGSMVLAAIVIRVGGGPAYLRAAVTQGTVPVLAVAVGIACALGGRA